MICVSIANIKFNDLKVLIPNFEMMELRLDLLDFSDKDYQEIIDSKKPIIATYRYGNTDDKIRLASLKKAILQGVSYIDIEIDAKDEFINEILEFTKKHNCKSILSFHNFKETPSKEILNLVIKKSQELNADFIKIATMANSINDVSRILSLYEKNNNLIAFNMGTIGKISRLACLSLGAKFTYASISEENTTAEGQLTYKELGNLNKSFKI